MSYVIKKFDFGGPLHSLIIPGKMHFVEEEMLIENNNTDFQQLQMAIQNYLNKEKRKNFLLEIISNYSFLGEDDV